jgi:hypothetical protein
MIGRVRKKTESSGVQERFRRLEKEAADFDQQMLNRAMAGQVQLDAILVLNDPHGDFEQFQDDRALNFLNTLALILSRRERGL